MKLVYRDLETQIEFVENTVNVLILERPDFFADFIDNLYRQLNQSGGDELFVLSQQNEILSLTKNVELVIDIFNLDLNNKKVLNMVYSQLREISQNENYYLKTSKIVSSLHKLAEDLIFEQELDLICSEEIDIADLMKVIEVRINDAYGSLLEKLIDYLNVMSSIFQIRVIIFVNLKTFLSASELVALYKEANLKKIYLLLVENKNSEIEVVGEKLSIVDTDLCEI